MSFDERIVALLPLLAKLRLERGRGFVIELAGMSNAGKTELMGNLRHLFYVAGAEVYAKVEGAFDIPFLQRERRDPITYNLRTLEYARRQLLRHDLCLFDVLIFERSLFDAYCWFSVLKHNGRIDENAYNDIVGSILLDKYRERIDLVIDFIVEPQVALEREITARYTSRRSVGTNIEILQAQYDAHISAAIDLRDKFRILQIDTSVLTREAVYEWVVDNTLTIMEIVTHE